MTFPLLPYVKDVSDNEVIENFSVTGQFLVSAGSLEISKYTLQKFPNDVSVDVDATQGKINIDDVVALLNSGVRKVLINEKDVQTVVFDNDLPSDRFAIEVSDEKMDSRYVENSFDLVFSSVPSDSAIEKFSEGGNRNIYVSSSEISQENAEVLVRKGVFPIINTDLLTVLPSENGKISISALFTSSLTTDRPDGLFTTLVTSGAPSYSALGVVYSSVESIQKSIEVREGVYQSRKRRGELWYKGKTSGATQKLIKLEKDCDSDVVRFVVEQKEGSGFCHLDKNYTCFQDRQLSGSKLPGKGLAKLDYTLQSRLKSSPEGSYTKRLFNDNELLTAKLKEELDELIEAGMNKDKASNEVAWECADLFYFAMVWCIKHGVSLADIEKNLDIKSGRVTRRKGDAKEKYLEKKDKLADEKASGSENNLYKMHIIDAKGISKDCDLVQNALKRPVQKTADIMKLVLPIIQTVQKEGDTALVKLTKKFDGVDIESPVLKAPFPKEYMNISDDMKKAIDISIDNIEKFHAAQLPDKKVMTVETSPGVYCSRFAKPIENVGLYVPGGTAVLPSTAMMLGVPAKVAGCSNIFFASPPSRETGKLTPEVVYVAHKLGAKGIVMAGGAQAITALAYGTESVIKCDKILGPGNQFVTAAKMYVQNDTQALCSIDMPAGPSEVLVIADSKADADFVASDLLSQAEHGVDSQVILIGVDLSKEKLTEIELAIKKQAEALPRKNIVSMCLAHSSILLVDTYEEAFSLSNKYAPEHLILQIENASKYVPDYIENAGSVFVGALSPESCGDYSSGTNHTLPTYGYARQYSGVNTATFQKFITSQNVTEEGLKHIGNAVMTLAAVEGLEAHKNAVDVRMRKLGLL